MSDDRPGGSPPPVPRWVKVLGLALIAALVVAVLAVALGGDHGPRRHSTLSVTHDMHSALLTGA